MAGNEFDKVYLQVEGVFGEKGTLFGKEWNEARRQQVGFLLERPLMLKVMTEKIWGPARLHELGTREWREAETAFRGLERGQIIEELADLAILLLTFDCLAPDLTLPSQKELAGIVDKETLEGYCRGLGINKEELIPKALEKIKINRLRNPAEAFGLADEGMQVSRKRFDHNWQMLKKKRDKIPKRGRKQDWWKRWLAVDEGGWLRESGTQSGGSTFD